jgi:putative chitobiose transport system permease protein
MSTSLKGINEDIFAYPPTIIPQDFTWINYIDVWHKVNFMGYFWNSLIVAGLTVVLNLVLSSLAAYPLARMQFGGKRVFFFSILATIMIPFQAIMLPVYLITLKLHLIDSVNNLMGYLGLVMPFAVSAFGIFLMRQAFLKIPRELEEAAIIDGCNVFQVFRKVVIPMVKPTLAVLAVFTFIGSWGEFLWPSIMLTKDSMFTLPVGINNLQGIFSANWRLIAAGSIISTIPIIIFFLMMQKYFISGENDGAIKG